MTFTLFYSLTNHTSRVLCTCKLLTMLKIIPGFIRNLKSAIEALGHYYILQANVVRTSILRQLIIIDKDEKLSAVPLDVAPERRT